MKRFFLKNLALIGILLLALLLRTYRITNPVLDWHSFRQADTASVTRQYVKTSINLLVPRYHDHSNIQTGDDNPEGYRLVEFPFVNGIVASIVRAFPSFSLEVTSRALSIIFSLGMLTCLFFLVTAISGKRVGYTAVIVGAILPYYIYYSRVIMPEPAMLFFSVLSLTCFYFWLKNKKILLYVISLVSLMLALLLKPFVGFLLPVYGVMALSIEGKKIFKNFLLYPFPILAVLPFLWWRNWISQFPTGIPASDWLFNSDTIRFRPAWFRWLFFERLIKLMAGYTGLIFYLASLYKLQRKELWIYGSWWIGMITYMAIIATGNVRHDYYQVLLIPIVIITLARGAIMIEQQLAKKFSPLVSVLVVFILVVSAVSLSWWQIQGYFNVNHWEYVEAGKAVDSLTPPNAKVIAPAFGDTNFLYQTNRTGWPIGFEIEDKIAKGATHYVTTSYDDEARELEAHYFTVQKTPNYLLLDLSKPKR